MDTMDIEKELVNFIKRERTANPFLGERSIHELGIGFIEGAKVALLYVLEREEVNG